ncbi:hypothetical protein GCM10011578_029840 [Streptomyces fuscichromogenes]|uniref:Uncharacterized protein n=1 Tax=Streptomyces fuscichromogenes TaxID=1324013 RepID=A0A918CRB6_9ACTN|nr:hypothetical protein GCM10011578_029840 [Streptomyces fuscichromogenes]
MLTMAMPIIPVIMYMDVPPLPTEYISTMAPAPRPIGRYVMTEPKSAVAGSPRTGGSASSTWPSGIGGPSARGERLATTVLNVLSSLLQFQACAVSGSPRVERRQEAVGACAA